MEDGWWFKSLGEEFGPVSFDDLVKAAQSGALIATDLVRHGELGQWQSAHAINQLCFGGSESAISTGGKRIDSLEQLVLEILRTQPAGQSKPTLEELGLARQDASTTPNDASLHILPVNETTVSPPGLLVVKKHWPMLSKLSPFRRQVIESTQTSEPLVSAIEQTSAVQVLPTLRRCERTSNSATSNTDESDRVEKHRRRRLPIRELAFALSGLPLCPLLFPEAWSKVSGYMNIVNWSWKGWGVAEAVLLIVLVGIAVRQRHKQLA